MSKCEWENGKLIRCVKILPSETYNYCPICGGSLEKPVKIEVGMFGKFWNDDCGVYIYHELVEIENVKDYKYKDGGYICWNNFTPGLPTDKYNEDGTRK